MSKEKFEFKVELKTPKEVVLFSKLAENYNADIDAQSQDKHYIVDAKSIMGIFGLDLTKPLIVSTKDVETGKAFMKDIVEYVVK